MSVTNVPQGERTAGGPALELRAYLEKAVPGYRAQWGDAQSFEARLAWQRMLHEGGWAAPSWPVEHGGRGLGPVDRVQCDLELSKVDAPMPAGVLGLQNVGPALFMFGTEEQKRSLPRIRSGEEIWAQGFSEPGAGSDLAALSTRAEPRDGGFVVNGQKVWTSNGMEATHCLLLVRTDWDAPRHKGISALLVDLSSPGVERRPLRQITGEAEFAEIFFSDVRVPGENLLGPLNEGWHVTMKTLGYERSGVINQAAALEREVRLVVEQVRVEDPLLRDELVTRWMEARLVGLMGARALAKLGEGQDPGAEQSVIKFGWSLAVGRLGETMMAVAGPNALLGSEPAVGRFLRSRASTIAAGTTEVLKNVLAERVLGLPRA
jgi:alkylation response protein AidB-like acyl-CoA dehydrogenase